MTYNPNTPLSTDRIQDTQVPIQTNFSLANTYFGVDHFEFDALSNNGLHKQVTLPDRTASPPSPIAGEWATYAQTSNSITLPYWRRDGSVTTFPVMPIKAFVIIDGTTGAIIGTAYNIASVVRTASGRYTVTLSNNAVTSADFGVLITGTTTGPSNVVFTYSTGFAAPNGTISIASIIPPSVNFQDANPITVAVIQFE